MECRHKIQLKNGDIVPCGKCPSCLANQRQEWVFRLKQEYLDSVFSIFVTLTYNDDHLPLDMSVNKRDIQLFHKRLRKHFPPGDLRFYVVSEYGENGTLRPHYHGLYFFKRNYDKVFIYDVFEKSWQQGFTKFGDVEEGSIVYCTKYCLKHSTTPTGRRDTFRLMSRMNGGLGYGYLEKMSDYHINNEQFSFVSSAGRTCRMPRYYRTKLSLVSKTLLSELDKVNQFNAYLDKKHKEFINDFNDFIRDKHFKSLDDAYLAFNEHLQKKYENQDNLVIKHCKKQKL